MRGDNLALVQEILRDIGRLARPDVQGAAAELARILREPHFQVRGTRPGPLLCRGCGTGAGPPVPCQKGVARVCRAVCHMRVPGVWHTGVTPPPRVSQSLLETHDSVAAKSYDPPPSSPGPEPSLASQPVPPDAVRMVGIRKAAGENLVSPAGGAGTLRGAEGAAGGRGGDGDAGTFWGAGTLRGAGECWGIAGRWGHWQHYGVLGALWGDGAFWGAGAIAGCLLGAGRGSRVLRSVPAGG